MSEGPRIPLAEAQAHAQVVINLLRPCCDRIEVAGSVRRKKADVGDIELVCIPKVRWNLLGEAYWTASEIEDTLYQAGYRCPRFNGEHFKQLSLGPCNCDLFLTTPECWGMIYTIRTGSAEFSHRLVTPKAAGGLMPSFLKAEGGRIAYRETGHLLETPEEEDVFKVMGLGWIPPESRI